VLIVVPFFANYLVEVLFVIVVSMVVNAGLKFFNMSSVVNLI